MFSAGVWDTGTSRRRCPASVWSLSAVAMLHTVEELVSVVAVAVAGVDLGLGDRVRGRVGPGLPDLELVVVVAGRVETADDPGRSFGERVGHHDPGQRLVAGVLDRDRVVDQSPATSTVLLRHAPP